MDFTTNSMLNATREKDCIAITAERKYYHDSKSGSFTKRSLRRREWQISLDGRIIVPRLGIERLRNEADTLRYISANTSIHVPKVLAAFEDDGAFYLITEYLDGVGMNELNDTEKQTVTHELQKHIETLRGLRSRTIGGPSGIIVLPYRAMVKTVRNVWSFEDARTDEYVFCRNDLSQHNVVVDPKTLAIQGIIDWEYAGFYPSSFEFPFYKRPGPSAALEGEHDDSEDIVRFFLENCRN